MTVPTTFGQRLRELRKRAGLTHEVLAERAELSVRTVSNLERDVHRPRRTTLAQLRRVLGPELDSGRPARCRLCHRC